MSVTVTVIDVNLGINVNDLISDNIRELTAENRQQIDTAIADAKAIQNVKNKKSDEAAAIEEALATTFKAIRDNNGPMLNKNILIMVSNVGIKNIISFVGRMRNWLVANNHPYRLASIKFQGEAGYILQPIAQETTNTQPATEQQPPVVDV